ncbi:MAG: hypothetical protein IK102_05435 [Treponema sp.]|nr:hypothetical protein [Treponema sp.]
MDYYCAMVITGEEKSFKQSASAALPQGHFYIFERRLHNRSRGWFDVPLFPGYVFFGVDELTPEFFEQLRSIKGFCRILYDNQNPVKITGQSLDELQLFIKNGEHWGISKVLFVPGQKIKAISGPLVGLEGQIVAVNRKRKQITVQSSLTQDGKKFDLLYEDVE